MRKFFLFLAVYLGKFLLWACLKTCRFRVEGLEQFNQVASQTPCIISLWHNRLAVIPYFLSQFAPNFIYAAFVSKSRDGEILAMLARSYRQGRVIRVPHNARAQALLSMTDELKKPGNVVLITPDGPRGPRYKVKPGILWAAKEAQVPIIPFTWTASRYWQLRSWDKLMLPKPFSEITVVLGEPIRYADASQENLHALEGHMKALLK